MGNKTKKHNKKKKDGKKRIKKTIKGLAIFAESAPDYFFAKTRKKRVFLLYDGHKLLLCAGKHFLKKKKGKAINNNSSSNNCNNNNE